MIRFIFLFLFSLSACIDVSHSESEEKPESSKYYEDIDVTKLEGINEMTKVAYPCIEIKREIDKKVIVYHLNFNEKDIEEYFFRDGIWSMTKEEGGPSPSGKFFRYRFVFSDSCVEFSYTDNKKFILYDVQVIKPGELLAYIDFKNFNLEPKRENLVAAIENAEAKHTDKLSIQNSNLMSIRTTVDNEGKSTLNETACYDSGLRSYFWFLYFESSLKKVECK